MQFISKQKFIFIVSGFLVLGTAIYAAPWKWHFWQSKTQSSQPIEANPMNNSLPEDENEMTNNVIGIKEVLSAHLFGQENMPSNSDSVPKTQQPLELHGIVFISHHPERAVALIAQAGGEAKDYKTGEEISALPGWKVYLISADSVQIEHQGSVELLELPRNVAQFNNPQAATDPATQFDNAQPPQDTVSPQPPVPENPPPPQDNPQPPPIQENQPQPQDMPNIVPPEGIQIQPH